MKSFVFCGMMMLSACSFVAPDVKLTGERTAIENQIIGEYREIEPDAWTVSTVKTAVARQKSSYSLSDTVLVNAYKMRELNDDSIRKYKNDEAAGENSGGYLSYRAVKKYEDDKELKRIAESVIDEENKARRTIFERSVILSGISAPADSDILPVALRFADEQRAQAQKNDWIQGTDGQWQRKK